MLITQGRCAESSRDVNRFSNGLKFAWIRDFTPITDAWHHSFVINVPMNFLVANHRDFIVNRNISEARSDWLNNCLLAHDIDLHGQMNNTNLTIVRQTDSRAYCVKYANYIKRLITMVKQNHDLIKEKSDLIRALLPSDSKRLLDSRKRGLFDFGGYILSGAFGLATEKDLKKVVDHLHQLGTVILHRDDAVKQSLDSLGSFSKAVDKRIGNLVLAIQRSALNTAESFNSIANDMSAQLGFLVDMLRKITEHQNAVAAVLTHLDMFYNALIHLTSGILPNFLVTSEMLRQTFIEINLAAGKMASNLHLISINPLDYYRRCSFTYALFHDHLIITVTFPLTTFDETFSIYELTYYDLLVPGQANATMKLKSQEKAVAIQNNHQHFFHITITDLSELKSTGKLARRIKIVQIIHEGICLMALFKDDHEAIKASCDFVITLHSVKSSLAWMHSHYFLLTATEEYKLNCGSRTPYPQKGCVGQCVLELSNGCQIVTESEMTTSSSFNASELSLVSRHVINLPYLAHFFQAEELRPIRGTSFLDFPPKLQLPGLKFFDNPLKEMIAEDAVLEMDMGRVVESIKTDSTLIHSLGDGIAFLNKSNSQIFGDYIEYVVLFLLVLFLLVTLQLGYCSVKLRTLSLVVRCCKQS